MVEQREGGYFRHVSISR